MNEQHNDRGAAGGDDQHGGENDADDTNSPFFHSDLPLLFLAPENFLYVGGHFRGEFLCGVRVGGVVGEVLRQYLARALAVADVEFEDRASSSQRGYFSSRRASISL